MQFITRPDIFTKFNDIRHKLQDLSITVKIVKIKSLRNFRKLYGGQICKGDGGLVKF